MAARPPGIAPPPQPIDPLIDETAPPQRSPLRGALPFAHGRPPAPPPPAAEAAVHQGPSGEETAPPARSPLAAALPFRHARPSAATLAIPLPTPDDLRRLAGGGEAAPAAPPPAGGAPVAASATEHFGLTLERFAALCAEVAVFPAAAEATFVRYGLASQKDRLTADLAWQERLRHDPVLMQQWQRLYLHYHAHHSQRGGQ